MMSPMQSRRLSVDAFYDKATFTVTYVIADPESGRCAVIDPVLDYDPRAARTSTRSADDVIAHVREQHWKVDWILETHAHADHLSGAQYIKRELGGHTVIGEHIQIVQDTFAKLFNLGDDFPTDGRQFDRLVSDKEELSLGRFSIQVMHTPGHTPACVSYVVGDAVFVGDTIFMPDYGTARADFPGGNARTLYRSIRRILALPTSTRVFTCHDYPPNGRSPAWESTVEYQRHHNIQIHDGVDEEAYVQAREARDKTLPAPVLIWPSLQVNIRGGNLPEPDANGIAYLRLPLNVLGGS